MAEQKLYCVFCGKNSEEVEAIVQGADMVTCVCGDCVKVCVDALKAGGHWPVATSAELRRGLMALAAYIGPKCAESVTAAMGDAQ
jgi:ATP-dependent protease Clp ATPase subunit